MTNMYENYIETHGRAFGLEAPLVFEDIDNSKRLVGAIELCRENALLVGQALRTNIRVDDARYLYGFDFLHILIEVWLLPKLMLKWSIPIFV